MTFAPKITTGKAGSGLHIHMRMVKDGVNHMLHEGKLSDEALIAQTRDRLAQEELDVFCEKMRQLGFNAQEVAQLLKTKGEST